MWELEVSHHLPQICTKQKSIWWNLPRQFFCSSRFFCCCCHFEYTSLLSFLSFISDLPFYVHILYLLRVNNNVNTVNTAQYSRIYDNLIRTCIKSTSLMGNFLRAFFVRLDFEDVLRFNQRMKTCIQLFRNFFRKSWLLPWILFAPKIVPVHENFTAYLCLWIFWISKCNQIAIHQSPVVILTWFLAKMILLQL